MRDLVAKALTKEAFLPYGEVIEKKGAEIRDINHGVTQRFHDLCTVDVGDDGGRAGVSLFETTPCSLPYEVRYLERHPLGSQAFIPMGFSQFFVLVAPVGDAILAESLELFITDGYQGVNFFKNTWHHTHLVLDKTATFVVVDRIGEGANLVECDIEGSARIIG